MKIMPIFNNGLIMEQMHKNLSYHRLSMLLFLYPAFLHLLLMHLSHDLQIHKYLPYQTYYSHYLKSCFQDIHILLLLAIYLHLKTADVHELMYRSKTINGNYVDAKGNSAIFSSDTNQATAGNSCTKITICLSTIWLWINWLSRCKI